MNRIPDRLLEPIDEQALRGILADQRARRAIDTSGADPKTAYGLACMLRQGLGEAIRTGRLSPVEATLVDMLTEEIVARAHCEAVEFTLRRWEAACEKAGLRRRS